MYEITEELELDQALTIMQCVYLGWGWCTLDTSRGRRVFATSLPALKLPPGWSLGKLETPGPDANLETLLDKAVFAAHLLLGCDESMHQRVGRGLLDHIKQNFGPQVPKDAWVCPGCGSTEPKTSATHENTCGAR